MLEWRSDEVVEWWRNKVMGDHGEVRRSICFVVILLLHLLFPILNIIQGQVFLFLFYLMKDCSKFYGNKNDEADAWPNYHEVFCNQKGKELN